MATLVTFKNMSKFSKHREKPKWKPREGSLVVKTGDNILIELGEIHEISGERWVWITDGYRTWRNPVRDIVETIKNGSWRVVKDGPIEPEKILKDFKFL